MGKRRDKNKSAVPVFLSVTTPHSPAQETFVRLLEEEIRKCGLRPRTLGRNEWSYEAPLIPIRQILSECGGAIVLAMTRTLINDGLDLPFSDNPKKVENRAIATPWTQLEAAMAFQIGHPIFILKEDRLHPEGILDPNCSGLFVRSVGIQEGMTQIPTDITTLLPAFATLVKEYARFHLGFDVQTDDHSSRG